MKLKGIDVSKHQGNIDWERVKGDGVQFAMLRMGYGNDLKSQDDPTFERNVKECERLGIPWGAYLYSYAMTLDDAKSEAKHALRLLEGKDPHFPVAFDMEDADGYKRKRGMPSDSELVSICYEFLDEVEKHGFYVSLYASLHWLRTKLNSSSLDRFDKWVAQWASDCDYKGLYRMWQYTSKGRVNGISGNVDMNIAYSDFNFDGESKPKLDIVNYKIKAGDNLSKISMKFDTTIESIMILNPNITDRNLIYAGDIIKVHDNR